MWQKTRTVETVPKLYADTPKGIDMVLLSMTPAGLKLEAQTTSWTTDWLYRVDVPHKDAHQYISLKTSWVSRGAVPTPLESCSGSKCRKIYCTNLSVVGNIGRSHGDRVPHAVITLVLTVDTTQRSTPDHKERRPIDTAGHKRSDPKWDCTFCSSPLNCRRYYVGPKQLRLIYRRRYSFDSPLLVEEKQMVDITYIFRLPPLYPLPYSSNSRTTTSETNSPPPSVLSAAVSPRDCQVPSFFLIGLRRHRELICLWCTWSSSDSTNNPYNGQFTVGACHVAQNS